MSRAAVYNLIRNDPTINGLGVAAAQVYASNAVDTPQDEGEHFIVIRWEEVTGVFSDNLLGAQKGTQSLSVWAHTRDRSYDNVNAILNRVKAILTSAVHVAGGDGTVLTQADWQGESGDLYDDGFHTLTRYHSFRVASR